MSNFQLVDPDKKDAQKKELTPKQTVVELDRYIIGQDEAKKAAAVALRNRWRRKNVDDKELQEEILPKNILMIGPTGVGKTEIARRLAKLVDAPFIKVEATKYTEIGYVGRDVESIVRDLTETAVTMVRERLRKEVLVRAREMAENRVLDALVGESASNETREKFRQQLQEGKLDDKEIELQVQDTGSNAFPTYDIPGMPGSQIGMMNLGDMIGKALGDARTKTQKMSIEESYDVLIREESDKLIDEDKIIKTAIDLVENEGIVFLDEMDKITARTEVRGEVNREGVQRDLLPLVEGTNVSTKYGIVRTEHILFIASGAFHIAKPSDLLPELQGRFPIRVELKPLNKADLIRILKEPEASLLKQYTALLETEGVKLEFKQDGIEKVAELATEINRDVENIGARRLHTIMEKLLEEISFEASEMDETKVLVDKKFVEEELEDLIMKSDLTKFIL